MEGGEPGLPGEGECHQRVGRYDAEVQGPEGGPNVQIIRTLTLDIYSADKYAHLSVYPKRVLPNGMVENHCTAGSFSGQ